MTDEEVLKKLLGKKIKAVQFVPENTKGRASDTLTIFFEGGFLCLYAADPQMLLGHVAVEEDGQIKTEDIDLIKEVIVK